MKKILAILAILVVAIGARADVHISTASELRDFSTAVTNGTYDSGATVYLDADIDLSGGIFTPIGTTDHPFNGTFDGQGHRITNMTISSNQGHIGFLGCVNGANTVIENLIIDKSCSITSTATASSSSYSGVAGLVGAVYSVNGTTCNVTVNNCGNEATVTGYNNVAGVVGGVFVNDNTHLTITNSFNTGNIYGQKVSATLCAYARNNYTFINCYNSGKVTGVSGSDTFYNWRDGSHKVVNCYDINEGNLHGDNVITAADVRYGNLCKLLNSNGATVFSQDVTSDDHPVPGSTGLAHLDIFDEINTAAELNSFADYVNGGFDFSGYTITLTDDIDLSGTSNFTPIGTTTHPFKGTFDGQGHSINYMTISSTAGKVGLFGAVSGTNTVIKNVIIGSTSTVASSGGTGVAGLIGGVISTSGEACNLTIEKCGNEATVNGEENVAGLLGGVFNNDKTIVNINDCYNTGAIGGGEGNKSGSIVGYARLHTNIRNTWNSGTVGGTLDWLTFAYTGAEGFDGTIYNCYTTVSGDQTANVTKIIASDVTYGNLCKWITAGGSVAFKQNVKTDKRPIFGEGGLTRLTELESISTYDGLLELAFYNNRGFDFSDYTITLANDIDMTGVDFTPIGTPDYPFVGTFDGQRYRIKNMTLSAATGNLGFFGSVAGTQATNTIIKNLIIDRTCTVTSTATSSSSSYSGVAGLVGSVCSASGSVCNVTVLNCGNEAMSFPE